MERKMKRILGILLSFVLVVGMMPTVSLADTITNHTGTVTFTEGENAPVEVGDILKKGATLTTTADRLYIYDENNQYIETVEKNDSRILAKDYTVTKVKSQISDTEREWFVYLDGYVQDYIWVGGIQVTEDNAANITGEESPTAYYDAGTRTLTLKDYHYSGHGYCLDNVEGGIVIAKNESVTIELIGENSITMEAIANETPSRENSYGIYGWLTGNSKPSITIIGKGSLATKGGNAKSNSSGIYVTYNITFEGGTVQAEGGNVDVYRSTGVANQGKGITIDGGNLVAKGGVSSGQYGSSYGVYAGIDDVTDKTVFESGSLKATGNTKAIYHSIVNDDNEDHEWGGLSVTENRTLFKAGGSDETAEDVSSYSDEKFVYVTAPMRMKQTVTFKVVNGSWDEGEGEAATADKTVTLTGYEGDTLKLKANEIPAVGSKPKDNTYKEGSWDVTPSAETAITEATTYTYTYAKKDSISKTVTFKVVNGSWDEGEGEAATADKTVTLTGYEGDTLKLVADQIPVVGSKPKDNTYKEGSWDVTPSTETEITAATTYTYTYAKKDAAVVTNTPAAKTLTYTGQVQELVIAGVADGGEMQYALGTESEATEDYSTSIPTGTDAGTYYVWYKVVGDSTHTDTEPVSITVTIKNKPSTPNTPYTPSTPGAPAAEAYTVPVSNENTVDISVNISEGNAVVQEITQADLDKITDDTSGSGSDGDKKTDDTKISVDVSGAKSEVTSVELSSTSIETLAKTVEANEKVDSVEIKMTNATVELDSAAVSAISEQKEGNTIKLVVENKEQAKLNETQKESLKSFTSVKPFQAYFESGGKEIHDFKGGKATVSIKFSPEAGRDAKYYHVYYVPLSGLIERYVTRYLNGWFSYTTSHFSDYAIVYDATMENETGKEDVTPSPSPDVIPTASPAPSASASPSPAPSASTEPSVAPSASAEPGTVPSTEPSQAPSGEKTGPVTAQEQAQAALDINAGLKVIHNGTSASVQWSKVDGAKYYKVYAAYCGSKYKMIKTVDAAAKCKVTIKKLNGKKLSTTKNIKVYVAAYRTVETKNGETVTKKDVRIAKTIAGHVVGKKNKKYSNAKKIKLSKTSYTLKKGKKAKIKAKTVLQYPKRKQLGDAHAKEFRYASSDKSIATVSKSGKITAKKKGSCVIYVYARNGLAKKVKVTVK